MIFLLSYGYITSLLRKAFWEPTQQLSDPKCLYRTPEPVSSSDQMNQMANTFKKVAALVGTLISRPPTQHRGSTIG